MRKIVDRARRINLRVSGRGDGKDSKTERNPFHDVEDFEDAFGNAWRAGRISRRKFPGT
jgi:hypothetical protein